jgi:hypothetical protein
MDASIRQLLGSLNQLPAFPPTMNQSAITVDALMKLEQ